MILKSLEWPFSINIDEVEEITDGEDDHLVVSKPADNLMYYFLAVWEQESNGIMKEADFEASLDGYWPKWMKKESWNKIHPIF